MAVKRILRYLVHTPNLGLWYPKGSKFDLLGYSDSDYASCKVDQKSTLGTSQFLGRSLVSWSSKKQNCVGKLFVISDVILPKSHYYVTMRVPLSFTKPLDESRFCALRSELNILDSHNVV